MPSNRVFTRSRRGLSTSFIQPPINPIFSSQPNVRVVQPNPRVDRRRPDSIAQTQPIIPAITDIQENVTCPLCAIDVTDNVDEKAVMCEQCQTWHHSDCLHLSDEEYFHLRGSSEDWICDHCRSIKANRIKWGCLEGEANISRALKDVYKEVASWRKNIFTLPRGKCGSDFLKELTRLIYLFVDKTNWERLSLPLVHIFVPLLLQKPGPKSKARECAKYLTSRLGKWSKGELDSLLIEGKEIQKRLAVKNKQKAKFKMKSICRLMLHGKVGQVAKFINNSDTISGVHKISDDIKTALAIKHPKAEQMHPDALLPLTRPLPNPVIYEQITPEVIQKCGRELKDSGGLTLVDADSWKHFLCSRAYGKQPYLLAEAISNLAKRLCIDQVHPDCLLEYTSGRLIPLDKGGRQLTVKVNLALDQLALERF